MTTNVSMNFRLNSTLMLFQEANVDSIAICIIDIILFIVIGIFNTGTYMDIIEEHISYMYINSEFRGDFSPKKTRHQTLK